MNQFCEEFFQSPFHPCWYQCQSTSNYCVSLIIVNIRAAAWVFIVGLDLKEVTDGFFFSLLEAQNYSKMCLHFCRNPVMCDFFHLCMSLATFGSIPAGTPQIWLPFPWEWWDSHRFWGIPIIPILCSSVVATSDRGNRPQFHRVKVQYHNHLWRRCADCCHPSSRSCSTSRWLLAASRPPSRRQWFDHYWRKTG